MRDRHTHDGAESADAVRTGSGRRALSVVQIGLDESRAYVGDFHAHSDQHQGHKWSLAAAAEGRIVGVAVIGRPTAPTLQNTDTWALEVVRVCVERMDGEGYRNACSFLYAAAWRSIKAMGYLRAVTYTQDGETGASIRAAGWVCMDYRPPRRVGGGGARAGRKSGGPIPGGERWETRAAAWAADLAPRPRVLLPGQMDVAA